MTKPPTKHQHFSGHADTRERDGLLYGRLIASRPLKPPQPKAWAKVDAALGTSAEAAVTALQAEKRRGRA